ncbi:hypothetical protein F53441_7158 [Fusarium austroafricanum]|uniref:F-box domain-containing protein n=1 Tax=Fusarium austroafricanum TaxID=2364996 RepID=A0A8H4KGY0_9HYPO|nr:hypothetical protein F53441_7158 [Fusarium austroafricanum]
MEDPDHVLQGTISHARCCLCGIAILGEFETPLWMCQFHTVYAIDPDANSRAYLSTSGRRRGRSDMINVDPSDERLKDKKVIRVNLMPYDFCNPSQYTFFLSDINPDAWGYPFHSACWQILTTFRPIEQEDLQSILNLCRSVPKQRGMLNWGHGYGGRARHDLTIAPGEENYLTSSPVVVGMDVNPFSVVELLQIFDRHASQASPDNIGAIKPLPKIHSITTPAPDPFAELPTDILLALVDHLTLPELTLMKQASRVFANLELPSRFWRRRFRPGREFDYIFEARDYTGGNWESICRAINASKSNGMVRYSLHLRRHIWDLCSPMHQILEAMRHTTCHGIPVKSVFEPNASARDRNWTTVSRALKGPSQIFSRGSRVIYDRVLGLPNEITAIYASVVEVFGRHYVSGLRFQDQDGQNFSIGFQHPDTEIAIADGEYGLWIGGFDVALDQHGVRGLSILFHGGTQSDWVGDYRDIPKRRLQPVSEDHEIECLKAGFDAAKLVALSIKEEVLFQHNTPKLWYPDIPSSDLIFAGSNYALIESNRPDSANEQDLPLCFTLFGGGKPEKLTSITVRHRVHEKDMLKIESVTLNSMNIREDVSLGFRRMDDRYSKDYDIYYEHEKSLAIDGLGGERIDMIKTCWLDGQFVGFSVSTSHDRTATFAGSLDVENYSGIEWRISTAGANEVVGFWATMETEPGFLDFGLVLR